MTDLNQDYNENNRPPSLIIPFAKPSGVTSFTSMWQVKHAIGTKKVGHTGTLDSFADGLLVLLTGQLTRLASRITDSEKEYLAWIEFGKQTDTLCPDGKVICTAPLPRRALFPDILRQWCGTIQQIPPAYSAVHIDGMRASDRMRLGQTVAMPTRTVHILEIETQAVITDKNDCIKKTCLRIRCSKGTYIRSLARDIGKAAGSCASLYALRRTKVGIFHLKHAAGYKRLPDFFTLPDTKPPILPRMPARTILDAGLTLTPHFAKNIGLYPIALNPIRKHDFACGKPIHQTWFTDNLPRDTSCAVFSDDTCIGLIDTKNNRYKYTAVFTQRNNNCK